MLASPSARAYIIDATMTQTQTHTTMGQTQSVLKRIYEEPETKSEQTEPRRKRQSTISGETVQEDSFNLTHQNVLLLHGPKQRYQHTKQHRIPQPENDREMLVQVQVVGLNPIDWKAPDFGFGLPALPCISGRDLAGKVVKAPKGKSRFRVGDIIIGVATDYRDSRKSAYQEYAIVPDFNACRLTPNITPIAAAPLGVAYAAATLALGICTGLDFSTAEGNGKGPDLLKTIRALDPETIAKDIRTECFQGIKEEERSKKGDWLVIWGGSSATGSVALQLAKLAGLRVICVLDVARNGARMLKHGADLLVDRLDPDRAVEIIRSVTGGRLRFGIDTRGRESASLLGHAMRSERTGAGRAHLVGLTGLPKEAIPGVVFHSVPIKAFHEAPEVGECLMIWAEKLLEHGLLSTPDIEIVEGGLEGINEALDKLRDGTVNGPRIVVPLQT